jgi:hypothetical protein
MSDPAAPFAPIADVLAGARCWGIELEPRYRVLGITVEPDPLRAPGTAGEFQLLCFPVSTFQAVLTRPTGDGDGERMELLTFDLAQLTAVSERLGGPRIAATAPIFGSPEPRPGSWGPRTSLEGRSSAADGTRATLTLDLLGDDRARLRLFARFDDVELRDAARTLVLSASAVGRGERPDGADSGSTDGPQEPLLF